MAPSKSGAAAPSLDKKKKSAAGATGTAAGGRKAANPTALSTHAQFLTLDDGTQVPVKLPPGMPADQAQGILAYLKSNPEAAKAAWAQAQSIMQSPGLANAFINMQTQQSDPTRSAAVYEALKDDPELSHVFEDVKNNGPGALQKYWDDTELMSKISSKLRGMQLNSRSSSDTPAAAGGGGAAAKGAGKPLSESITSLHDAAKWGDVEAAERLLAEGADVNGVNERGISPLGVAVGFNRKALVTLLLDAGADLEARDGAGNTVLHYAAGYGRLELVQLLLERGADIGAVNNKKLRAVDAAKMNQEKHIVAFLEKQEKGEEAAAADDDDTAAAKDTSS